MRHHIQEVSFSLGNMAIKRHRMICEKAGRYFFLCKASFAGMSSDEALYLLPLAGIQQEHSGRQIDSLDIIADRLKNAVIECLDY